MPKTTKLSLASTALAALLGLSLAVITEARADLSPPPGYVEACVLEKQQGAGEECFACKAYYGNNKHCASSLEAYGFSSKCRSRGASVWSEVWCRKADASAKPVPQPVIAQLSDANAHPPLDSSPPPPASTTATAPDAPPTAPPASTTAPPAPTGSQAAPSAPPAEKPGGCGGCSTVGTESTVAPVLLLAFGAALLLERRRSKCGRTVCAPAERRRRR